MIKFENYKVIGWKDAIRGMRNPMNSWNNSDSNINEGEIGENDLLLMKSLVKGGTDHRKFMRMLIVYVDITAPLYWWKEFDTYKVGTVSNSCSTMHKIHSKEFELDDFSHEHLTEHSLFLLNVIISHLNVERNLFNNLREKDDWWQMIQLLPSSYNQRRTIMLNYEVISNIYASRKNHILDEWMEHKDYNYCEGFCDWIKKLPHSELIIKE